MTRFSLLHFAFITATATACTVSQSPQSQTGLSNTTGVPLIGNQNTITAPPISDQNTPTLSNTNTNLVTAPVNPNQRFIGRALATAQGTLMSWSATAYQAAFQGSAVNLHFDNVYPELGSYLNVFIDGNSQTGLSIVNNTNLTFSFQTTSNNNHVLLVVKETEGGSGAAYFKNIEVLNGHLIPMPTLAPNRLIEIIGDSISAGYGDLANSANCPTPPAGYSADPNFQSITATYGYLTAKNLGADWSIIAYSGKGLATNRDGSTTATMPMLYLLDDPLNSNALYTFNQHPDAVVINLGTNDFGATNGTGINPNQAVFEKTYQNFVATIRSHNPNAVIILCLGPMLTDNYPSGANQLSTARTYIQDVVNAFNSNNDQKVAYLEFPVDDSNYGCDSHPNAYYHSLMATILTTKIEQLLNW